MYKLLTCALARILHRHALHFGMIPPEQKAMQKGSRGCLDALATDDAVSREARMDRRHLSMVWLDIKKAPMAQEAADSNEGPSSSENDHN